jgi:hypothetical protein
MPFKDPEKRRAYRRKWYALNSRTEKDHVKRRKLEIKKWLENYKKNLRCANCSENHPATIDFHHREMSKKDEGIAYLTAYGYSIDRIKEEIAKCDVLCANCHRKVHYKNNKL